jgi:hypothetical protein
VGDPSVETGTRLGNTQVEEEMRQPRLLRRLDERPAKMDGFELGCAAPSRRPRRLDEPVDDP